MSAPPDGGRRSDAVDAVTDFLVSRIGLIVEGLLLVAAFSWMLWVRLRPLDNMIQGGTVFFSGTDPYYHFRNLLVYLNQFPSGLIFDPWTLFPQGTSVSGQFSTPLFEGLLAAVLLVAHGGVPDPHTARMWAAVYPAVLGALTVVPVYIFVRRATNRIGAVYAGVCIAFMSGGFLRRSLAGTFDHHVAEVLFSTAAAAGVLAAVEVSSRESGALSQAWRSAGGGLLDRVRALPRDAVKRTCLWGAGAGALLAAYILAWNYGILFVVIFDLFALLFFLAAVRVGRSTSGPALALATTHLVAAALVLVLETNVVSFNLHRHSLLQPALLLMSAAGVAVLQALRWAQAELVDRDPGVAGVDLRLADAPSGLVYLGLVAGAVLLGYALTAFLLPDLVQTLLNGWDFVTGSGKGGRLKTIAEAKSQDWQGFVGQVGNLAYPAIVAVLVGLVRLWRRADPAPALLLAWGGIILVAALSQVRFSYYAGAAVAVLNGYLLGEVARDAGLDRQLRSILPDARDPPQDNKRPWPAWAQVAAVALVVVFLLPGLVLASDDPPRRSWESAKLAGPGEAQEWQPGLEWMRANTPTPPSFDLNESYDDHPGHQEGDYGVLSWWDYGHWIQLNARRAPVANPFRQSATAPFASDYFTTPPNRSIELLRDWEGDQRVRYVIIDDAMAAGKFGAITVWAERQHLVQGDHRENVTIQGRTLQLPSRPPAFDNTTLARLYFDDANGTERYRLVHELTGRNRFRFLGSVLQIQGNQASVGCFHQTFPSRRCPVRPADLRGALQAAERGEPFPVTRLNGNQVVGYAYNAHYESPLKIYERVEGAVLTGEAPAGSTVTAQLTLQSKSFRTYGYDRSTTLPDGDGNATYRLRVSHATAPPTAEAGRTVTAAGPYTVTVTAPNGTVVQETTVTVPDAAVLQGRDVAVGPPST